MKKFIKILLIALCIPPILYMAAIIVFLSLTNPVLLTSYAMIEHRYSNMKTLPIPFGRQIALALMGRSINRDAEILFLGDLLILPAGLREEGEYQGYNLTEDAEEIVLGTVNQAISLGVNVDRLDEFGCTSLHWAVWVESEAATNLLTDRGADTAISNEKSYHEFCRRTVLELLAQQ